MRITDSVRINLVHSSRGVLATDYWRTSASADRPAEGIRRGRMRCSLCGEHIAFQLANAADTQRRKHRDRMAGLCTAIMLLAMGYLRFAFPDTHPVLLDWMCPVGALMLIGLVMTLRTEDGVQFDRARNQGRRSGPHDFKSYGVRFKPVRTPIPATQPVIVFDDE